MKARELQDFIHRKIPLTRHMGLRVQAIGQNKVVLKLPLIKNSNHLGTGFGGSIMSAQAVCCWAWFLVQMQKQKLKGELVVKSSSVRFLRPVKSDFTVETNGLTVSEKIKFLKSLKKNKEVTIRLTADAKSQKKLASRFTAVFVIKLRGLH